MVYSSDIRLKKNFFLHFMDFRDPRLRLGKYKWECIVCNGLSPYCFFRNPWIQHCSTIMWCSWCFTWQDSSWNGNRAPFVPWSSSSLWLSCVILARAIVSSGAPIAIQFDVKMDRYKY